MPKPTILPRWATALLSPSDIVEPTTTEKNQGWQDQQEPPHSKFNWLFNVLYQWTVYLDGLLADDNTWTGENYFNNTVQMNATAEVKDLIVYDSGAGGGLSMNNGTDITLSSGSSIVGATNSQLSLFSPSTTTVEAFSTSANAGVFQNNSGVNAALIATNSNVGGSAIVANGDVEVSESVFASTGYITDGYVELNGAASLIYFTAATPLDNGVNLITPNIMNAARWSGQLVTGTFTVAGKHNVASITTNANEMTVNLQNPMVDTGYTVSVLGQLNNAVPYVPVVKNKTVSSFQISFYDPNPFGILNLTTAATLRIDIAVMGPQQN